MKITDLKETDRPREKALATGVESLTDAELLAIIMGSGSVGINVMEVAQAMLLRCDNNLATLARMSIGEMRREFRGVGPTKAVTIRAAIALGKRAARSELTGSQAPCFTTAQAVYDYMWPELAQLDHEEFHVLALSRSARLKSSFCVSRGGTAATVVDVKMVIRHALDRMADHLILVHNHPSGTLRPSPQDDALTRKIKEAGALFDIGVRDHVIVTSAGYYSYYSEGRL